jgi:hypothetical protein
VQRGRHGHLPDAIAFIVLVQTFHEEPSALFLQPRGPVEHYGDRASCQIMAVQ